MSIFIKNYRKYLSENDIKQSYICLVTDIEKNKLSRILNGSQNITEEDMNKYLSELTKHFEEEIKVVTEIIKVEQEISNLKIENINKKLIQNV